MSHLANAEMPVEYPAKPEVENSGREINLDGQTAASSDSPGMGKDLQRTDQATDTAEGEATSQTSQPDAIYDPRQGPAVSEPDAQPPANELIQDSKQLTEDVSGDILIPIKVEVISSNQKGGDEKKAKGRQQNDFFGTFVGFIPRGKINRRTWASGLPLGKTQQPASGGDQPNQPQQPRKTKWGVLRKVTRIVFQTPKRKPDDKPKASK